MDTLRGYFGTSDYGEDDRDFDDGEEDVGLAPPLSPVGQDERRMQVRAYNHWAGLLEDRSFPAIEDLEPENLPDFGPYSVLLDFSVGIDDPAVPFLGKELARECGTDGAIARLSDVPSRSLLSRITDHYLQILANQAPIGFEAEFVNQRGCTILYRGILLPFSSDNDTIDFVYGVINWKEMADQLSSDELLLEIDQALLAEEDDDMENLEQSPFATDEDSALSSPFDEAEPEEALALAPLARTGLPRPSFGSLAQIAEDEDGYLDSDEGEEDEDLDGEAYYASLLSRLSAPEGDETEDGEDYDDEGEHAAPAPEFISEPAPARIAKTPIDLSAYAPEPFGAADEPVAFAGEPAQFAPSETDEALPAEFSAEEMQEPEIGQPGPAELDALDPLDAPVHQDDADLHDMLAAARELALAARSSEDRSRVALYEAVGRAYDVSIVAGDNPAQFEELVAENGLTVQERAPMTPVVKLVFGADYDKTRLTEYAAVLGHAHRLGIARGALSGFLAQAEGGLKGVVQVERRLRREESGRPVDPADAPREKLARKLRQLETHTLDTLDSEGAEFALVMIRRLETGEIVMLGEIDEDIPLLDRAARSFAA